MKSNMGGMKRQRNTSSATLSTTKHAWSHMELNKNLHSWKSQCHYENGVLSKCTDDLQN
jgi:hypothetical protein